VSCTTVDAITPEGIFAESHSGKAGDARTNRPQRSQALRKSLLGITSLAMIIAVNVLWKHCLDRADCNLSSYMQVAYKDQLPAIYAKHWYQYLLPIPEMNGVWATTGILAVHTLEQICGSTPRAYYLVSSLAVTAVFVLSWLVYRYLLLSSLAGLCLALTTYNYHVYHISGSMIMPLITTFMLLYSFCQYQLFRPDCRYRIWVPLGIAALALFALSYEGWLDYLVFQWVAFPILALAFYRQGDWPRVRTALGVLAAATLAAVAYIAIKVAGSFHSLHRPGLEADVVFNYTAKYGLIGFEDVLVNIFTFFFTTVSTYFPAQFCSYSLSSWYYGEDDIVRLQAGYHASHTRLVLHSHMFLWRFYAGVALAFFAYWFYRVARKVVACPNPAAISCFLFMTMTMVGSPTHAMVKMRPMHCTPVLGYQCYLSIAGFSMLICYVMFHLHRTMRNRPVCFLLLGLFTANLFYCALTRPALLSHMACLSGLGTYPDPVQNLKSLLGN
jgi:hypothetical protein